MKPSGVKQHLLLLIFLLCRFFFNINFFRVTNFREKKYLSHVNGNLFMHSDHLFSPQLRVGIKRYPRLKKLVCYSPNYSGEELFLFIQPLDLYPLIFYTVIGNEAIIFFCCPTKNK